MTSFFFYNKLINEELINKINPSFQIYDGYILVTHYDKENNVLEINNNTSNNTVLHGKIVNFNMKLEDIMNKLNQLEDIKFKNKTDKYTLDTIWASKIKGGICKTYIIY
jgi:hypothetical protein